MAGNGPFDISDHMSQKLKLITILSLLAVGCNRAKFDRNDPRIPKKIEQSPSPSNTNGAGMPSADPEDSEQPIEIVKPKQPRPAVEQGIRCEVFELAAGTQQLPDFSTLSSVGSFTMSEFDVYSRNYKDGFPSMDPSLSSLRENYGLDCRARLKITEAREYKFWLSSDDGSKLIINGNVVIDSDGTHLANLKSGRISLSEGLHDLQVLYFQGPGWSIALELFWTKGLDRVYVPAKQLFLP